MEHSHERQIHSLSSQLERMQLEHETVVEDLREAMRHKEHLQLLLKSFEEQNQILKDQLHESNRERIELNSTQSCNSMLLKINQQLSQDLTVAQNNLDVKKQEVELLQQQLTQSQELITALRIENQNIQRENQQLQCDQSSSHALPGVGNLDSLFVELKRIKQQNAMLQELVQGNNVLSQTICQGVARSGVKNNAEINPQRQRGTNDKLMRTDSNLDKTCPVCDMSLFDRSEFQRETHIQYCIASTERSSLSHSEPCADPVLARAVAGAGELTQSSMSSQPPPLPAFTSQFSAGSTSEQTQLHHSSTSVGNRCRLCEVEYPEGSDEQDYIRHSQQHDSMSVTSGHPGMSCPVCLKVFSKDSPDLRAHVNSHFDDNPAADYQIV